MRYPVLTILVSSIVWAQPLPPDHPKITTDEPSRQDAPTFAAASIRPVPIRNLIDRQIFGKMEADGIRSAGLSTDAEFFRRVYLDLTGRLPEPDAIRAFLADPDPAKRDKVIDSLMETPYLKRLKKTQTPFLDRWVYFFGDLFKSGTAQLGTGRNLFRDYLYINLLTNVPYDQMVREMLTARTRSNWLDGAANFLVRDHVDDDSSDERVNHEDTCDEIAITTGKVFLGINLECVSCHDGKGHLEKINLGLSRLKRSEMWRQASFFSKAKIIRPYAIGQEFSLLENGPGYDTTKPSVLRIQRYKTNVDPQFLLNGERPRPDETWREAFARILTSHPQFARATVNMIWAELMGVGIVDPPYDFDLDRQDPANPPPAPWTIQPSHPELLDELARDFVDHNYDLRHLIRTILKSSAYQLSSYYDGEWKPQYGRYFARHHARRLPAEMVADAIIHATGRLPEIKVSGADIKVNYVMQTRSSEDLGAKDLTGLRDLLVSFGQSNRDKGEKDTSGNMAQSAVILNGAFTKDQVKVQKGGRLYNLLHHDPALSEAQIVDEMFLAFLSRLPRKSERDVAMTSLRQNRESGVEDLGWSLINKLEFIHNY